MDCPFCGHETTKVLDTRTCRGDRIRKRRCVKCGNRFSTAERITVEYIRVRKRDGRVEPFSRSKLRLSVLRAVAGLGLTPEDIDIFVGRVLEVLQPDAPDIPVPTKEIGDLVLQQMQASVAIADVARIRYAMVFLGGTSFSRGFRGTEDFLEWLEMDYGPSRVAATAATPYLVVKRSGRLEPFDEGKLVASVAAAAKGRGTEAQTKSLGRAVNSHVIEQLCGQGLVTSQQIAAEVLKVVRKHDTITYLRYAAVVKRYQSVDDVWRDALGLRSGG